MFARKIIKEIDNWRESLKIKKRALVIKGLRQVGKTTVVKEYCKSHYKKIVYINFMDNESIKEIFNKDIIIDNIIRDLSAYFPNTNFIPNETVIIFDEIQECNNARASIKAFMLDGRFDIIATGSLIGLRGYNKKIGKGIPTGFEYVIQMYPMDFEEYLWAKGISNDAISYVKECYKNKTMVSDVLNNKFFDFFREYLCVGGMPDVVNTFLITNDLNQVYKIQKGILENYKNDFGKHLDENEKEFVNRNESAKIIEVFNSIPNQLAKENKKFQYSNINKNAKGREYRSAITWLEEFGLIKLCYNLSNLELPLEGNKKEDIFKIYLCDTGLFVSMLGQSTYKEILNNNFKVYKGAIYENIVADALIKSDKNLYYFSKSSGLEIDFILDIDNEVIPLEVKSSNGHSKSLKEVLTNPNYNIEKGIKLIDGNIGQINKITTYPLYMCFFINS